jgi:hypothetical protein
MGDAGNAKSSTNMKGRDYLEDLGAGAKIMLNCEM